MEGIGLHYISAETETQDALSRHPAAFDFKGSLPEDANATLHDPIIRVGIRSRLAH